MVTKIAVTFCVISMLAGVACATPATVGYIIDGDTFSATVKLDDDIRISVRVRIRNVDTPEIHGQCAHEIEMANAARQRLGELIPVGTDIELTNITDDKYLGRIDANVLDATGNDVGKILINEKLGRAYNGGHRAGWCD
ncbi:MAG: nuclease [Alphaproteobacteria bacterium]|nr:nuclease [Alphaproteobacteria bacterium]